MNRYEILIDKPPPPDKPNRVPHVSRTRRGSEPDWDTRRGQQHVEQDSDWDTISMETPVQYGQLNADDRAKLRAVQYERLVGSVLEELKPYLRSVTYPDYENHQTVLRVEIQVKHFTNRSSIVSTFTRDESRARRAPSIGLRESRQAQRALGGI